MSQTIQILKSEGNGAPVQVVFKCETHHLPYATVDLTRRVLVIMARHNGETCRNVIPLSELGLVPVTPASENGAQIASLGQEARAGEPVAESQQLHLDATRAP